MTFLAMRTSLLNPRIMRQNGFWVCANPLASKKALDMVAAIQTIVGQVNSEFQEDVTRMIRLGACSRLDGDPAWEISGGQVREWARTKGFKVTSIAGGESSYSSRPETCVGILKPMGRTMLLGSGLPISTELWPLAATHAAFCHRCRCRCRFLRMSQLRCCLSSRAQAEAQARAQSR